MWGKMKNYRINEAAEILQVTDKTIRNYIKRGFLNPEKWNGAWQISENEISELFWKKFGKPIDQNQSADINHVQIDKSKYEIQQQSLGKLAALEVIEKDLKAEIRNLNERNAQLEASSASGWTEARALKDELKKAQASLTQAQENDIKSRQDLEWLRREMDGIRQDAFEMENTINTLRAENQRLTTILSQRSLGISEDISGSI